MTILEIIAYIVVGFLVAVWARFKGMNKIDPSPSKWPLWSWALVIAGWPFVAFVGFMIFMDDTKI